VGQRRFPIFLILPSHYDRDGYVIQWWRSTIPSNSLASVYGLLAECADQKVLGPDVDISIEASDEMNTITDIKRIVRAISKAGSGFVGLVGVQSNPPSSTCKAASRAWRTCCATSTQERPSPSTRALR